MFGSPVKNKLTEVALMVRDPARTKAKPQDIQINILFLVFLDTNFLLLVSSMVQLKTDLVTQVLLILCRDGKGYSSID